MATTQYHTWQDGSKAHLAGRELTISDHGRKRVIRAGKNGYFRRTIDKRSYSLGKDWQDFSRLEDACPRRRRASEILYPPWASSIG